MLESLFNAVAGLRPVTEFKKMTPARVLSGELIEILRTENTSSSEHLLIGKLQGKHLYRSL